MVFARRVQPELTHRPDHRAATAALQVISQMQGIRVALCALRALTLPALQVFAQVVVLVVSPQPSLQRAARGRASVDIMRPPRP